MLGVGRSAKPRLPAARSDAQSALNAARIVLERQSGTCHREDAPTARECALAIFNLNEIDWARRPSEAQLRSILFPGPGPRRATS
jgi:hypothetical protein